MIDEFGRAPLHYAAMDGDASAASALLAAGADPNAPDRDGLTPLHLAAEYARHRVAQLLLDAGAEVDAQDRYGNSPLWKAVFSSRGDGRMIRLLRSRGADPFLANRAGQTPVGLARLIANYPVAQWFDDVPAGGGSTE